MSELVILMMETEQPEGLSARKLVVETAKHNVITAYRADYGLALLRRFPLVDLILLHSNILLEETDLIAQVREINEHSPIVIACPSRGATFPGANFVIESHRPQQLLDLLANEFHVSKSTEDI